MNSFKIFTFTLLTLWITIAQSQTNPEKIRYTAGFLTTNYELGEKDISQKNLMLHLEKYSPEGYYNFRRGVSIGNQSIIWGVVGLMTTIGSVGAPTTEARLAFGGLTIGFIAAEFIQAINSGKLKQKGIDIYILA